MRQPARRIKASPIARRVAREWKIDLANLQGSGPGGRIVKADVEAAGRAPAQAAPPVVPAASSPTMTTTPSYEPPHTVATLSAMRRTIARRLGESKRTIPHFYLTVDVNVDELLRLRAQINAAQTQKVSVNDLLVKALGCALQRTADANVRFADESLHRYSRADVAVAVAAPTGLLTPVVRDAGAKSVLTIAAEMYDFIARARAGKLMGHEYQGGSTSLSNLGMYGVRQFDAVINPPQASILAVGATEKRAVVLDDQIGVATQMSVTGSFDHRAIDGAVGAQLLACFKQLIERPLQLLL
jgi:pyruvate dehydrogenase E2 component (dihydrolipoamide acetyltransferase)